MYTTSTRSGADTVRIGVVGTRVASLAAASQRQVEQKHEEEEAGWRSDRWVAAERVAALVADLVGVRPALGVVAAVAPGVVALVVGVGVVGAERAALTHFMRVPRKLTRGTAAPRAPDCDLGVSFLRD